MDYMISVWRDVHDNAVKTLGPGDWNWVLEQLEKPEVTDDKYSAFLFNLTRFDATAKKTGMFVEDRVTRKLEDQRRGDNIVKVTGLLIDYDNESLLQELWSMDAVAERFKEYTYLMYSSHSYWKNAPVVERFRLVLPFAKPIAIQSLDEDWYPYVPAMKAFIGYEDAKELPDEMQYPDETTGRLVTRDRPAIDKQSFNPVQGYFLPSCPTGRKVVYCKNLGTFLDPSTFERSERVSIAPKAFDVPADATRGGEGPVIRETFDVLAWLKDKGLYLKPLAAGKHSIICPWHHEHTKAAKTGAVLLPGKHSPLPNIYCQHNHEVSTWQLIKEQGDKAIRPYCLTRPADDYGDEVLKILLYGSANCTIAALGRQRSSGTNEEACLYRRLPSGSTAAVLGLDKVLAQGKELTAQDLPLLAVGNELPLEEIARRNPGNFDCAFTTLTWWAPKLLGDAAFEIELLDADQRLTSCTLEPLPASVGGGARYRVMGDVNSLAFARLRFGDGTISTVAVVARVEVLLAFARDRDQGRHASRRAAGRRDGNRLVPSGGT